MIRSSVKLAVCGALVMLALAPATSHAGDKGNSRRSSFSQSSGGGGGNSSMKLNSSMSRKFSGLSSSGGGTSSISGNASLNSNLSRSKSFSKSLSQTNQSNPSWMSINNSAGKYSKNASGFNGQITGNNLTTNPSLNLNGRARRAPTSDVFNRIKLADAIQNGTFQPGGKPIDSGFGNGTSPQPGKFQTWDPNKFVDVLKHGNNFPGNGKKIDPGFNGKFCDTQNKDCHNNKCFPWWTIGVGGCYPKDCHDHHDNHNHCHAPIYNVYPPITNVTVVQHVVAPVQPVFVEGVDLELLDLRLVDFGDPARNLGPRYRITLRNRGVLPAGNFQVLLLASPDGNPQPGLPTGIVEIAGLAPGQMFAADVRLPMTPELATLGALVVALDSATQIAEFEERNNVAVLDRTKILLADLATTGIQ